RSRTCNPRAPASWSFFRARQITGKGSSTLRILRSLVDCPQCCRLFCRQAIVRILTGLAYDRARIELALAGVVEHSVLHAVGRIAGGTHCVGNGWNLRLRNEAVGIDGEHLGIPDASGKQGGPVVRGGARHDAVVVFRVPLRLHKRLATAVRASKEVRSLRFATVKTFGNRLRRGCHLVNASVAEVDNLLRMPECPCGVNRSARMPGVRAGRNIAATHCHTHLMVINEPRKTAIASSVQLPVPAGNRHPDFYLDIGIGGGHGLDQHSAKSGKRLIEGRQVLACKYGGRTGKLARRYECGTRNLCR